MRIFQLLLSFWRAFVSWNIFFLFYFLKSHWHKFSFISRIVIIMVNKNAIERTIYFFCVKSRLVEKEMKIIMSYEYTQALQKAREEWSENYNESELDWKKKEPSDYCLLTYMWEVFFMWQTSHFGSCAIYIKFTFCFIIIEKFSSNFLSL